MLFSQLPIELPDDLVASVEERLPRPHLRVGEPDGSHAPRVAARNLHVQGMRWDGILARANNALARLEGGGWVGATGDVVAGLSLGLALASAPGPVQAVLLTEAVRGGIPRGLRALAGAASTFGVLLGALAFGLSLATPTGSALRILQVVGGAFLLWLAVDGLRSRPEAGLASAGRRTLPPAARGALAVLLNPGAWLFLGAVASPLFAAASAAGGTANALFVAAALAIGLGIGDVTVVLLGGLGLRQASERVVRWVRRALAILLAGLGVWLLVSGLIP